MKIAIVFAFTALLYISYGISMNTPKDKDSEDISQPKYLFESARLYYREFTHDDAPALIPILGDKEVMEYCVSHEEQKKIFHAMNNEEIKAFLARVITSYKENGWGRYAGIKKDDGTLIGYCGLKMQAFGDKNYPELGYRLAKKYWNLGYATEAACATRDYLKEALKLPKLISIIEPSNEKSINVITKAGFSFSRVETFYGFPANIYEIKFATENKKPSHNDLQP